MSEHEAESLFRSFTKPFSYSYSNDYSKILFMNKDLHKTELIDLVMKHDIHHRTPLSENKYIDDCISKGYLLLFCQVLKIIEKSY